MTEDVILIKILRSKNDIYTILYIKKRAHIKYCVNGILKLNVAKELLYKQALPESETKRLILN